MVLEVNVLEKDSKTTSERRLNPVCVDMCAITMGQKKKERPEAYGRVQYSYLISLTTPSLNTDFTTLG